MPRMVPNAPTTRDLYSSELWAFNVTFESTGDDGIGREFIDASIKAILITIAFVLLYLSLPHLLSVLNVSENGDPIRFFQNVDNRPQKFAYLASLALIVLMTLATMAGVRIRFYFPIAFQESRIFQNALIKRVGFKIFQLVTFLRDVGRPSVRFTLIAIVVAIVAISFFRDSFGARTGNLLFLSDSHAYLDFAGTGEVLMKGKLTYADAVNAYGIGTAVVYALLRHSGFPASLGLIYDLAWAFNIAFLFLWGACLIKIASLHPMREWVGFIFILGIAILVPPLITTKQVWTMYPTMAANRYIPFLLLFAFLAWSSGRSSFRSQMFAALCVFIGLCFSPDVGVVAAIGFTAGIILDRQIDWKTPARILVWLAVLATVCIAGSQLVLALSGYDLGRTLQFIFASADRGLASSDIPWTPVGLLTFIASTTVIIYVGPQFFRRGVPAFDRIAFIAAGMILTWGVYFIRRPDKNYWIYDALLMIILLFFASKAQGLKIWKRAFWPTVIALVLFVPLVDEAIHRSVNFYRDMVVTQIREHRQPKHELAGVYAPDAWFLSGRAQVQSLRELGKKTQGKLLAVTGQPYLETIFATENTTIQEGGFSISTVQKINVLAARIVEQGMPVVAIDGPGSPMVFRIMGEQVAMTLSESLRQRGYTEAPSTTAPGWIVLIPVSGSNRMTGHPTSPAVVSP